MKKLFIVLSIAFIGITSNLLAQDKKSAEPGISFTESTYDFGAIEEGPDYTHVFKFKNTGKAPLIINTVNTPCGCTVPTWTKEPILPGKTGEIKATYHAAGKNGSFTKTLSVQTNMGEGKDQFLTIRGDVKAKGTAGTK